MRYVCLICEEHDCHVKPNAPNAVVSDSSHSLLFFWFQLASPPELPCYRIRTYGSRCFVEVVRSADPLTLENPEVMCYLVYIVSIRDKT